MDLFRHDMKAPVRPAPAVPSFSTNRYSPVTNWNDDPFGADVFEPQPQYLQKKKPPPRPPPPKLNVRHPDGPAKPSHFIRKPTVLSSLLSRKSRNPVNNQICNPQSLFTDCQSEVDGSKMFAKCELKNVQTGTLIDFSSPPSSPTFTTRSSSDGLSVDSFGSDATTSTNHQNIHNGGSASQTESGFEDDFDLFLNCRKIMDKDDTLDDFQAIDPFSPQPVSNKPPIMKKPVIKNLVELPTNGNGQPIPLLNRPTIIRAKPARPKPPENYAILKSTFGNNVPIAFMNVNTAAPIQKITNGFGDSYAPKSFSWDSEGCDRSDREASPPMPSIPPPPPPPDADDDLPVAWLVDEPTRLEPLEQLTDTGKFDDDEPYAIALFDYFTDHPDDLCFSINDKIKLIRRVNEEWLHGKVRSGMAGLFPANRVDIKVPLPEEPAPTSVSARHSRAIALYDFEPDQPGDLRFVAGDKITVMYKISDKWCYGECNGVKGQFPLNYVQML